MKKHILLFVLLSFSISLFAQDKDYKAYVIAFYNLENLYDTIKDPKVLDDEFLPDGAMKWNTMKYMAKLENMAEVLSKLPRFAAIGVSEIENRGVLEDLVAQPSIKDKNLQIVHFDGPDRRGVDVALLYDPYLFRVKSTNTHRVKSDIPDFITRDQLVVTGTMGDEEVSIIVNHWPSRGGGNKRSTPRRRDAALTTRSICDSLFALNPNTKIIIMGDLNDDPKDASIVKHLGAKNQLDKLNSNDIYNPFYALYKKGIGSLGYNNQWNLFDQIMVSSALTGDNTSNLKFYKAEVFNRNFLRQQEGRYKGYPLRTFSGGAWTNGYSDHFPVLIYLVKEIKTEIAE